MTAKFEPVTENGAVIEIPLNRLKKSPANARKVPHRAADIEARAASIAAKGVLQPLVVAPEFEGETPSGYYFVTIGESRRLAQCLRVKRKEIKKTEPVRCVIDTVNDPLEISLDENVNRTNMHPADEFEAFKKVADDHGWGAEEIAARFGVTPQIVRQRMRLGAVSPKLIALYREGELTLDHLMAFAVADDHARQEQVFEGLTPFNRQPHAIRRAMTDAKVHADDKRALFVGHEDYQHAGGSILRDLFTEDHGGWFEDAALLDRLVIEKLESAADQVRVEGWTWVEVTVDFPHSHGFRRVYPRRIERSEAETAQIAALSEEYDGLVEQWADVEDLPAEVDARLKDIDAALDAFSDGEAYDADDIARGGAFVFLGTDGMARVERGFIRAEDDATPEPEPETTAGGSTGEAGAVGEADGGEDDEADGPAPLSDRLTLELSAYRTAGLREALGRMPDLALIAVVHAMALPSFFPTAVGPNCLEIKTVRTQVGAYAPGLDESPAGRAVEERHAAWAVRLPAGASELWAFLNGLGSGDLLDLLAHCASLTVNALQQPWERRPAVLAHAEGLARAVGLDMAKTWTATRDTYLGRVTKARIVEAVREGVGAEAADRLVGLKKAEMVEAAEGLLNGAGWLPPLLRLAEDDGQPESDGEGVDGPQAFAAE